MTLLDQTIRTVPIAVIDLEFTGLDPVRDRVCEIAIVRRDSDGTKRVFHSLVAPAVRMSPAAAQVTGIRDDMLRGQPVFQEIAEQVREMLTDAVVIAHNLPVDLDFLMREFDESSLSLPPPVGLDTLEISRRMFAFPRNGLSEVCKRLQVPLGEHHRARSDAEATLRVYDKMTEILDPLSEVSVAELLGLMGALAPNSPRRLLQQQVLAEAFRRRVTVFIDYISTADPLQGMVHREVAIWKLKPPRMQGWCYLRNGERVFRLERIRSVEVGGRSYEVPKYQSRI